MAYARLVSRFTLDEGAGPRQDVYGAAHPNDLTDNNTVGSMAGHIGGGAALFTAANSEYLSILDSAQVGLNPGLGDFSLSLWIYPIGITANAAYNLIGKGATGNTPYGQGYGIAIYGTGSVGNRRIYAAIGDSVGAFAGGQVVFENQLTLNAWNHLVIMYDRDNVIFGYLNGVRMTVRAGDIDDIDYYAHTTGACNPNAAFAIGAYSQNNAAGFGLFFDGGIDDVRYYSGLLELGEIKKLAGLTWTPAMSTDELALRTSRAGVLLGSTGRAGAIPDAARLKPTTGEILWDRSIDRTHILTPYNQGQPPNAADQAVYTTVRE